MANNRSQGAIPKRKPTIKENPPPSVQPIYYPEQKQLADLIVERIALIQESMVKRSLEFYDDFDFMIYTARYNTLEKQTTQRLAEEGTGCFSLSMSEEQRYEEATKRVHKYHIGVVEHVHKPLQKRVIDEPRTLFLIIADEAHWGTSKQTDEMIAANHELINTWTTERHPNVVIILVSATPYNLLTEDSRIYQTILYDHHKDDPQLSRIAVGPLSERDKTEYSQKLLHHIKWTESYDSKLRHGLVVTLQIPKRDAGPCAVLSLGEAKNIHGREYYPWIKANAENNVQKYNIKGGNGLVKISTILDNTQGAQRELVCIQNQNEPIVGFVDTGTKNNLKDNGKLLTDQFEIIFDFGQDIFELKMKSKNHCDKAHLCFDSDQNKVHVGTAPDDVSKFREAHAPNYSFIIMQIFSQEAIDTTHLPTDKVDQQPAMEYLSFNYFYNSMRLVGNNSLIRNDERFEILYSEYKKSELSADEFLAAEFTFYILLAEEYERCDLCCESINELVKDLSRGLGDFTSIKRELLLEFDKFLRIEKNLFEIYNEVLKAKVISEWEEEWKKFIDVESNDRQHETLWDRLLACMLYLDEKKLREIGRNLQANMDYLSQGYEQFRRDFYTKKGQILFASETYRIVEDLMQGDRNNKGHMKIVRVPDKEAGDRIYESLRLANIFLFTGKSRPFLFEIIRDYGDYEIKDQTTKETDTKERNAFLCGRRTLLQSANSADPDCKACGNPHKEIRQYCDLDNLPCIIILVGKGRLGDTFPASLDVYDSRLTHREKTSTWTGTPVVQGLGRLFRYSKKDNLNNLPYALVGTTLYEDMNKTLGESAVYYASFPKPDDKMKRNKIENYKAKKTHYDSENNDKHSNRILLEAEPQIGKTGAYLRAVALLRERICGDEPKEDTSDDESSGEEDKDTAAAGANELDDADKWIYPHWKMMKDGNNLKKSFNKSKYDKIYGLFKYGNTPLKMPPSGKKKKNNSHKPRNIIGEGNKYLAHNTYHNCGECNSFVYNQTIKVKTMEVVASIPRLERFQPFINSLSRDPNCENPAPSILKSFIFTPSHGRAETATVNYRHTMVTGDAECDYVHVLVVRRNQFEEYVRLWQFTHVILSLPDSIPGEKEYNAKNGGIGFCRRFIQMFAEEYNLPHIFMIDDNFTNFYKMKTETKGSKLRIKRNSKDQAEFEQVPLFEILHHLESTFVAKDTASPPVEDLPPWPGNEENLGKLEVFTGPMSNYGVLGLQIHRGTSGNTKRPFNKTHCFALVLVNINALQDKAIKYNPWPVWEDCTLNCDCDTHIKEEQEDKLWVCKFNLFKAMKRYSKSWMPDIYTWTDSDSLLGNQERGHNTVDEINRLAKRIQGDFPIKRLEIIKREENTTGDSSMKDFDKRMKELAAKRHGISHFLMVEEQSKKDDILKYLTEKQGIGGFEHHWIVLPTNVCRTQGLTTKRTIEENIVKKGFMEPEFEVFSTHNPAVFDLKIILVYIKGKIKNPKDVKQDSNVGKQEGDDGKGVPISETNNPHATNTTTLDPPPSTSMEVDHSTSNVEPHERLVSITYPSTPKPEDEDGAYECLKILQMFITKSKKDGYNHADFCNTHANEGGVFTFNFPPPETHITPGHRSDAETTKKELLDWIEEEF